MTKQIWKYPMGMSTTHEMPVSAEFLCVQVQGDAAVAWFLVLPDDKKTEPRKFQIYGTGHDIPLREKYLGTFQSPPFVWHLFEDISDTFDYENARVERF